MEKFIIVGIDPGLDGGVALFDLRSKSWKYYTIPIRTEQIRKTKTERELKKDPSSKTKLVNRRYVDYDRLHTFITKIKPFILRMSVEKPGHLVGKISSVVQQSTAYINGTTFGICKGIFKQTEAVHPKTWQNYLYKPFNLKHMSDTKSKAKYVITRLYPSENFFGSERARTPHEGIIDAVLIAEYTRQLYVTEKVS